MIEKPITVYTCEGCGEDNTNETDVQECAVCGAEICVQCGVRLNYGWAINTTSMNDMQTVLICGDHNTEEDGRMNELIEKKRVKIEADLVSAEVLTKPVVEEIIK